MDLILNYVTRILHSIVLCGFVVVLTNIKKEVS